MMEKLIDDRVVKSKNKKQIKKKIKADNIEKQVCLPVINIKHCENCLHFIY